MDTQIRQKHPRLRKYFLPASAAILVAGAVAWTLMASHESTYRVNPDDVLIGEVTQGEFNDYIHLSGRVVTGTIVQVSALETGIVETKWVEEGAMVAEGDIILTLRNPALRQQILDSESQLAEKQNMLRDTEIAMEKDRLQVRRDLLNARTELNRKRRLAAQQSELYKENLTSREDYMQAQEDMELARESLALFEERLRQDSLYRSVQLGMMRESLSNMQENFALVRQRADNLNIRASHSGQLGTLSAELGQNIGSGQLVGQINILDNYKLAVSIDEHYIDRVATGIIGKATRQNTTFDVEVCKVFPEVNGGQFRADLAISGAMPGNLRVGQTYPVDLQLGSPVEAVMVPKGPFFQSSGGKWVYVLASDGHSASRREVKIGRQNPRFYEVVEGLSPGERIITSSYTSFGDADRILL